ncbi:hypothetical protein GFS60_07637 (plasmid) [Rhodococcus sp. WAY2]|nr:hypothetical protein GFS60_07637 [Rhodococcus sp. WAY2]
MPVIGTRSGSYTIIVDVTRVGFGETSQIPSAGSYLPSLA